METPAFYIPPKKYTEESTVVTMRLPKDMLRELDDIAKSTGRTRSEVMSLCLEFALGHLELGASNDQKQQRER